MSFAALLTFVFYVLGIAWLIRICISFLHIKKSRKDHTTNTQHTHIDILLPVLEEDARLRSFVEYFNNRIRPTYPEFTIWIITTEQEIAATTDPKTWQIADELANKHSAYIRKMHYPKLGGVMAHQLNFAIKNIRSQGIFVVYNADSQPDPETLEWVNNFFKKAGQSKIIFQQYGNYLRNFKMITTKKWKNILLANGLHQNRCTLGYEYYKALQGRIRASFPSLLRPLNYCIGHGLFFSSDVSKMLTFSEKSRNEDCVFGLEAGWQNIPIIPIPYFDASDSTVSVNALYYQKSNWFFGPFQAFFYYQLLLEKYGVNKDTKLAIFSLKLFMQSVGWILWPLSGAILIIYGLYTLISTNMLLGVTMVLALPFYLIPPSILAHVLMRKLQSTTKNGLPKVSTASRAAFSGAVVNYIISGLAGMRGLLHYKQILNSNKGKTPTQ